MKKMFLTMLGVLAMALMFSLNYQDNALVESEAFADGVCCREAGSICIYTGFPPYADHYYSSSGSCKSDKTITSVIAP